MIEVPSCLEKIRPEHIDMCVQKFGGNILWDGILNFANFAENKAIIENFNPFVKIEHAMFLRTFLCEKGLYRIDILSHHAQGEGDCVTLERLDREQNKWKQVVFDLDDKGEIICRATGDDFFEANTNFKAISLEGQPTAFLISCAILYSLIDQELANSER